MSATGTLLLRLAGPMQSWGTQSRFTIRDTGREPSKSGVVGLLCAALGRPRAAPVDDLAALRMGVRVDREGTLAVDYHTAGGTHRVGDRYGVAMVEGKAPRPVESHRYYLADADFLVGLEGDIGLLTALNRAVQEPVWQLFLGRKAFVPALPIAIPDGRGLRAGVPLLEALKTHPWDARAPETRRTQRPERLRLVIETTDPGGGEAHYDEPVGAAFRDRRFALRYVTTTFVDLGNVVPIREEE